MYSDLDRQQMLVPWTLWAADMPNVIAVAGLSFARTVVANCVITELRASAQAITGSSQFVVQLLRGTTVVATLTSAVPYVAGVIVAATGLNIQLSKGDLLTLKVSGTDADTDDITGLIVEAALQPLANAPST
jgi:hypothetical protein